MSAYVEYVEAAMVACPRCNVAAGRPCIAIACKHNYRNCQFKICSYWKELPEPHLERAVKARQESAS